MPDDHSYPVNINATWNGSGFDFSASPDPVEVAFTGPDRTDTINWSLVAKDQNGNPLAGASLDSTDGIEITDPSWEGPSPARVSDTQWTLGFHDNRPKDGGIAHVKYKATVSYNGTDYPWDPEIYIDPQT